jgi:hypothetical protein
MPRKDEDRNCRMHVCSLRSSQLAEHQSTQHGCPEQEQGIPAAIEKQMNRSLELASYRTIKPLGLQGYCGRGRLDAALCDQLLGVSSRRALDESIEHIGSEGRQGKRAEHYDHGTDRRWDVNQALDRIQHEAMNDTFHRTVCHARQSPVAREEWKASSESVSSGQRAGVCTS